MLRLKKKFYLLDTTLLPKRIESFQTLDCKLVYAPIKPNLIYFFYLSNKKAVTRFYVLVALYIFLDISYQVGVYKPYCVNLNTKYITIWLIKFFNIYPSIILRLNIIIKCVSLDWFVRYGNLYFV